MNRAAPIACLLLVALCAPLAVSAHGGGAPALIVPVDYIGPGLPFPVIAADLGSDSVVDLRMVRPDRTADLGTVTAGPDGHFDTYRTLPEDYPTGQALLVASGDDGSQASLELVIGQKRVIQPEARASWWQDPSVLLLGTFLLGAAAVAIWAVGRSRSRPAPVAVPARRRVPRKARRG